MPLPTPESQIPSPEQVAVQVPDVVEWNPDTQTHSIVSPTLIVDVLLPLCESTNDMPPPGPTWTVRTAAPGGVGVGVGLPGADVGVIVGAPGPDVGVSVGAPGPDVGVADIGEVVGLDAGVDASVLDLDEIADMRPRADRRPGPEPRERPDDRARLDPRAFEMREAPDGDRSFQ